MSRKADLVAVLGGAGAMGRAAVHHLAVRRPPGAGAGCRCRHRTPRGASSTGDERALRRRGRARSARLARALRGAAVVVHCAPYAFNLAVMEAALEAGCHYVDLGGLFHTTRRQLRLRRRVPPRGAPGRARHGQRARHHQRDGPRRPPTSWTRVRAIRVYNGGTDFTRYDAPLAFGFSPDTVLDELTLPPMVFTRGRFQADAPLSGGEDFAFDLGTQRVHPSLHSEVATLPLTYRGKGIRECFFKIAYDPVLIERMSCSSTSASPTRARVARGGAARRAPRLLPPPCRRRPPS